MLKTIEVDQNPKLLGHPFTSHWIMKYLPGMLNLCTSQLEIHIPNPIPVLLVRQLKFRELKYLASMLTTEVGVAHKCLNATPAKCRTEDISG